MDVVNAMQHSAVGGHRSGCACNVSKELQTLQRQQWDISVARVAAEAATRAVLCMEHERQQQQHAAHDREQGPSQAVCLVHSPAAAAVAAATAAAAALPQLTAPGQSHWSAPQLEGAGAPRARVGWGCQEIHTPAFLSTSCKPKRERLDLQQ